MIYSVKLPDCGIFDAWREMARIAISHGIEPNDIDWIAANGLFGGAQLPNAPGKHQARVPPAFLKLAQSVILDLSRFISAS